VSQEVARAWDRIEAWLAQHLPSAQLNPPAAEDDIAALETKVGVRLPDDLRASLLRHDGEDVDDGPALAAGMPLLGVDGIDSEWTLWTDMQARGEFEAGPEPSTVIRTDEWFRRGWIPFAGSDGQDFCIDYDPGPDGRAGQLVSMDHETGATPHPVPSFTAWLTLLADELESGVWVVEDGYLDVADGATTQLI
jgi:cell wall assembly regulator SMI1